MVTEKISPEIQKILTPPETEAGWESDLERFLEDDISLTRKSVGESAVKAIQRVLIFLGYSTTSRGAFKIDGDFGRGTNRAVAQFQYENNLTNTITEDLISYSCNWRNAHLKINMVPDAILNIATLNGLISEAKKSIKHNIVMCGDFEEALVHLNAVHTGQLFSCRKILQRYGDLALQASSGLYAEKGKRIQPQWILAIIKQETSGVVRPRFEQHLLTRYRGKEPGADIKELRYRSMSMGLGQVLGVNYKVVGASSPQEMFTSPLDQQVLFVARFLAKKTSIVSKLNPTNDDFHKLSRYYNGSGYKAHHYHESLERWFKEFVMLM